MSDTPNFFLGEIDDYTLKEHHTYTETITLMKNRLHINYSCSIMKQYISYIRSNKRVDVAPETVKIKIFV